MNTHIREINDYYDSCESDYALFMNVRKNLSMHFGYWDKSVKTFSQAMQRINSILAEKAGITEDHIVLDAGCGVGGSSLFLSQEIGCTVYGITVSERQAGLATGYAKKRKACPSPLFSVADYTKTPFKEHSFDVVWAIESVCHAENKRRFIAESSRLLKDKGVLVIADAFASSSDLPRRQTDLMNKWLNGWGVKSLETEEMYRHYLSDFDFRNIVFTDITRNILRTSRVLYLYSMPSMFFGRIARCIHLMNATRMANICSAYYQHKAIKNDLWKYGILCAQKS